MMLRFDVLGIDVGLKVMYVEVFYSFPPFDGIFWSGGENFLKIT